MRSRVELRDVLARRRAHVAWLLLQQHSLAEAIAFVRLAAADQAHGKLIAISAKLAIFSPSVQLGERLVSIKFACPSCGKQYQVKAELAGKKAKCKCGTVIPIPVPQPIQSEPQLAPLTEEDPLGADPLGGDPLGAFPAADASLPGSSDPLFDDALPAGGQLPSLPAQFPAMPAQSASQTEAKPVASAPATEQTSFGTGAALGIGIGISGIGAGAGAMLWAAIAIMTGYEIGWIAWGVGIGAGAGMAVAHHISDKIDDLLGGVIASVWAIVGILAAKFVVYQVVVLPLIADLGEELGELLAEEVSFARMFGPMDAIFFLLAIATAYKIGSGGNVDD